MRTIDAATSRTGIWVWLAVIVGVYLVLAASTGWLLTRLADRQPSVTASSESAP